MALTTLRPELIGAEAQFRKVVEEAANSSFSDILGETGMHCLVYYAPTANIPDDPKGFHDKLAEVLKGPAHIFEHLLVRELYRRLGLQFSEQANFDFVEAVEQARTIALKKYSAKGVG